MISGSLAPIGLGKLHSPPPRTTSNSARSKPCAKGSLCRVGCDEPGVDNWLWRRACGDDDDVGVDRRASGDGHARLSEPSLVSPEEAGWGLNNIKNRPLFGIGSWLFVSCDSINDQKCQG